VDVRRLGLVAYQEAWALQRRLADERRAGLIPDTLILLEHPHTYTIGRSGTRDHVYLDEAELAARGITCLDVDRGGDVISARRRMLASTCATSRVA
jgi:lipoate-protein ligase B